MLKSVHLKNFKLHEDTTIEAAPITVFIGPNNTGKSSVFQALLALKQAAARNTSEANYFLQQALRQSPSPGHPFLFEDNRLIDIGQFADVVRRDLSQVEIGVSGTASSPRPSKEIGPLEVHFDAAIAENVLASHEGNIRFSKGRFAWRYVSSAPRAFPQPFIKVEDCVLKFEVLGTFHFIQSDGLDVAPGRSPELVSSVAQIAQTLASAPVQLLISLHPIFPLRGFEEWGYPSPQFPGANLERLALTDRAVALASTLASNYKLRKDVSERLQELLNIGIEIETVGPDRVKIYATSDGKSGSVTLFSNEGTGANQLPFILVPIALTPKNDTLLLSEPEAHLHPKGQCNLTRVLLTVAKKENIQFFIETHSEHVLHVILNAVGRGDWAKDDVALHYFENVEGTTKVKQLGINEHGQVDGGLPGFFDQSLAELTEFLDALKKT
jgi:energy-coupling factor transporter ATP-binding protein EcfA2